MKINAILFVILSELCVNLAAGWLGAALIVPALSVKPLVLDLSTLTLDIFFSMIFLVLAFQLRKVGKDYE